MVGYGKKRKPRPDSVFFFCCLNYNNDKHYFNLNINKPFSKSTGLVCDTGHVTHIAQARSRSVVHVWLIGLKLSLSNRQLEINWQFIGVNYLLSYGFAYLLVWSLVKQQESFITTIIYIDETKVNYLMGNENNIQFSLPIY